MNCRHCGVSLDCVFVDLGFAPISNSYLERRDLQRPETYYPLKLFVCSRCRLVQTQDCTGSEDHFRYDYAYFSSTSSSWLRHAEEYSSMITKRLGLGKNSLVLEVASNDGYLLKNFVSAGIPCLGVEPAGRVADAAEQLCVPVLREFFGAELGLRLAEEGRQADLVIGNNVYAHAPDVNDFTAGLKAVLKPGGVITLEFPHLLNLIRFCQFDTIYHEHFSYFSLDAVKSIFYSHSLRIWDVQELSTHGGSLRVYGCHLDDPRPESASVRTLLEKEKQYGLHDMQVYKDFSSCAERIKDDLVMFLIEQKRGGRKVAAYGAAAKGSTLLNYAGIKPDLISFVCDAAPSKQGKFMPGSHIPVLSGHVLQQFRPDTLLILPWNIRDEIVSQHSYIRQWGGKFAVAVPVLEFF
ncbi:C-methyltransferase [Desulfonatronospira thiodismutans ASO3-1]|uniref:C-methyltransferase n=1 Tax=Desulfonatronospira thiodismutans ASO3-1 TaxID=555779 RepID=D6SN90_9BACT|nr:class I SAM-dependent methyltransferase [Desulfonatronospira thiodismutans]EFI34216.1 C-methyltransferase [Desulfonatronospira thiodismutans ASO3-1]